MSWERVRAGLVSGIAGFAPLLLVIILAQMGVVTGDGAVTLVLVSFPVSILLGGGLAGYLAGQGKRRRREYKVVVGAISGLVAALLFGIILETLYLIRSAGAQGDTLAVHPLRVTGAIMLLCAMMVAVAMVTTQLTAKPLPPPRRTRKITTQMPAVPPNAPHDTRASAR